MSLFRKSTPVSTDSDFGYIKPNEAYFDCACQSLRPNQVIDALNTYYKEHNSCGERVKYAWGITTDQKVEATREKVIDYLKLKKHDYFVSFTLNTTYGLNLILSQFNHKKAGIKHIVTSEIEHNSTYLSTMVNADKNGLDRIILERAENGSVDVSKIPANSLVVLNAACNFDGRRLENINEVIKHVHSTGGYIIIDAAQAMAHSADVLYKTEPDAICFSAHKMYAPSLGGIVMRKDFAPLIDTLFIGGGMVDDVERDKFLLSSDNPEHLYTKFEAGLQAWGEIIGLGAAIDWLNKLPKSAHENLAENSKKLFDFLKGQPRIHVVNSEPQTTISFYVDGLDSHLLSEALSDEGIMVRSGYFCVHYYLDHVKHYPPLVRFSLGYQNTTEQVDRVIEILRKATS